jgi:hypothetical protein
MSTIWRISSSRPTTGSILPFARALGQVGREALERLLLAHLRRRHRAAGFARLAAASADPSGAPERVLRRALDDRAKSRSGRRP